MPMYFPDLKSVQRLASDMSSHEGDKKYMGLNPKTEEELPQARKELGIYMREIWKDEVMAIEIEEAVDESNYTKKFQEIVLKQMMGINKKKFIY